MSDQDRIALSGGASARQVYPQVAEADADHPRGVTLAHPDDGEVS
jgi:hypothetical protein